MKLKRTSCSRAYFKLPVRAKQDSKKPPIESVGGVVCRWKRGQLEFLLIRKQGGYWTMPKGRKKMYERDDQALLRELYEETGLSGVVGSLVKQVRYSIVKKAKNREKHVSYYFVLAHDGVLRPCAKEKIVDIRWFSAKCALRRIRRGRLRHVLRVALQQAKSEAVLYDPALVPEKSLKARSLFA
jgi:8-oxo-dGTP pyrophosphatase MutT (NUDIX family)